MSIDLAFLCGLDGADFEDVIDDEEIPETPTPGEIARVDYDSITPEQFEQKFAATNTPVVFSNASAYLPMTFLGLLLGAHGSKALPLDFNQHTLVRLRDFCEHCFASAASSAATSAAATCTRAAAGTAAGTAETENSSKRSGAVGNLADISTSASNGKSITAAGAAPPPAAPVPKAAAPPVSDIVAAKETGTATAVAAADSDSDSDSADFTADDDDFASCAAPKAAGSSTSASSSVGGNGSSSSSTSGGGSTEGSASAEPDPYEMEQARRLMRRSYLRNLHVALWFPDLLPHITFPSVFGHNYLSDTTRGYPKEYNNWYELFINTRDCVGFPFLHRDTCHTHAFTMQLAGVKQFWLFPPDETHHDCLYPSSIGLGGHRSMIPSRDIVRQSVDLQAYPKYGSAQPLCADLRPGELLFLPEDWWHTTTTVSDEPSVSLGGNFVTESNKELFFSSWREFQTHLSLRKHGAVTFM